MRLRTPDPDANVDGAPSPRAPLRRVLFLLVIAAAVGVGIDVGLSLLAFDPDVARVLLVTVVIGAVAAVLVQSRSEPATWESRYDRPAVASGQDNRTSTYVRVLEDHRTAATPGPGLRERLRSLTVMTLSVRHGLGIDDPAARLRIGPRLRAVLDGPARRLSVAEIDACLEEIEGL